MKKLITLIAILLFASSFAFAKAPQTLEVLPLLSSETTQANRVWVGTFQLAWNDLMDGIIKGQVEFDGGTPAVVQQLNRQLFKADQLNENSYYKTYGKVSPELKKTIETALKEKFNEKSDILDAFDWTPAPQKYLVYAMLKKDFKFLTAFNKLKSERFGSSRKKVDYFGIDKNSDSALDNTIGVMFYNSSKDFAVEIYTKGDDRLYLYRTNDNKSFDKLYSDMFMKKAQYDGPLSFKADDEFKVPNISLYKEKSFKEVTNRRIKGTDMMISDALETIDFKMDNEGVKLKSEAAIMTKLCAMLPDEDVKPRKFYFNDTFVLFLQEADKNKPYFALRVNDVSLINKTGRK